MEKHQVYITVPKRKDWPSYWCLQREFKPGSYQLEVDERQLVELKEDPVIVLSFNPPAELKVASKITAEHVPAPEAIEEEVVEKPGRKLKISKATR